MVGVGYIRVSTAAQAGEDRFGIAEQRSMIMEYAEKNGIQVVEFFIDRGESGVKENRPAMNELLFGVTGNPPIECVLVAKSDRIARDMKLYYYYLMLMEKKGMELISVSEQMVDDGSGLGGIYKALMLFVAEQERKNITLRTRGGRMQKAKGGGFAGGQPPYGYGIKEGDLVVVYHEAKILKKIYELHEEHGLTAYRIAKLLNEAGIQTRKRGMWSSGTITGILRNKEFYEGIYKYGGVECRGDYEPLIVDGAWQI